MNLNLPRATDPDGRRYWAFIVILGGCIVMTLFAAVGVYFVRGDTKYSFYLAMAAHVQIFFGLGAFGWVLGRRLQTEVGRGGVKLTDSGNVEVETKTTVSQG